jgi:hypothetical protein
MTHIGVNMLPQVIEDIVFDYRDQILISLKKRATLQQLMTLHAYTLLKTCSICDCMHHDEGILSLMLSRVGAYKPGYRQLRSFERTTSFDRRCPNCLWKVGVLEAQMSPHCCHCCRYIFSFPIYENLCTRFHKCNQTEFWTQFCNITDTTDFLGQLKYLTRHSKQEFTSHDRFEFLKTARTYHMRCL